MGSTLLNTRSTINKVNIRSNEREQLVTTGDLQVDVKVERAMLELEQLKLQEQEDARSGSRRGRVHRSAMTATMHSYHRSSLPHSCQEEGPAEIGSNASTSRMQPGGYHESSPSPERGGHNPS